METYEALEPALLDGWVRARSLHERADVYSHPMRAFLESKAYGLPKIVLQTENQTFVAACSAVVREKWRWPIKIGPQIFGSVGASRAAIQSGALVFEGESELGRIRSLVQSVLRTLKDVEVFYFENVEVGSLLEQALTTPPLAKEMLLYLPTEPVDHHLLEMDKSYADYLSKFNSKKRNELKRKIKETSEALGDVSLKVYRTPEEAEAFSVVAEKISGKSWQGKKFGRVLGKERGEQFVSLAKQGWFFGFVLFAGDHALAFEYDVADPGASLVLAEEAGYDPEYASFQPGKTLQVKIVEYLAKEHAFRFYDFGTGDHPYKRVFSNRTFEERNLFLVRRSPRMSAAVNLQKASERVATFAREELKKRGVLDRARRFVRKA